MKCDECNDQMNVASPFPNFTDSMQSSGVQKFLIPRYVREKSSVGFRIERVVALMTLLQCISTALKVMQNDKHTMFDDCFSLRSLLCTSANFFRCF